MHSNRTANFKLKEEEIKNHNEAILKQLTTPFPKFNLNFNFLDNKEKETSNFSFKNDLLSKRTYNFLKGKDECLAAVKLDDFIPNNEEENKTKNLTDKEKENKD